MWPPETGDRPIPNSYWIKQGRFAAGEYPGAAAYGDADIRLKLLMEAGINHFIDLTEPHELGSYVGLARQYAAELGATVAWERHPIRDASIPRAPERMTGILDAIDHALSEGESVYVHCWGGIGRTGTAIGCWLVRRGLSGDEALRRVAEWWRGAAIVCFAPLSPETAEQTTYVRHWREISRGSGTR